LRVLLDTLIALPGERETFWSLTKCNPLPLLPICHWRGFIYLQLPVDNYMSRAI
jgi:hypothetical protein